MLALMDRYHSRVNTQSVYSLTACTASATDSVSSQGPAAQGYSKVACITIQCWG